MSGKAKIKEWLITWTGINPGAILARIPTPSRMSSFRKDLKKFKSQYKEGDEVFPITKWYPLFFDKKTSAGSAYGGYFWQDLYVAQRIFKNNPERHIDVGSRIDGFVAHVATFRPIEVIDVRPLNSTIPNVQFTQLDIMNTITDEWGGNRLYINTSRNGAFRIGTLRRYDLLQRARGRFTKYHSYA